MTTQTKQMSEILPYLCVEHDCLIHKTGEVTICYKMQLPSAFTLSEKEYDSLNNVLTRAIKTLPMYSILHKQDWIVKDRYVNNSKKDDTFFSRSFEKHFEGRPFYNHYCYLYITLSNARRFNPSFYLSTLFMGNVFPKDLTDKTIKDFLDKVIVFERIINDSKLISLVRITEEEILGGYLATEKGLLDNIFSLHDKDTIALQSILLKDGNVSVGENKLSAFSISDNNQLPNELRNMKKVGSLSTDNSSLYLSLPADISILLDTNHIYNQYLYIGNSDDEIKKLKRDANRAYSLKKFGTSNEVISEAKYSFADIAVTTGEPVIRTHFNVICWDSDEETLKSIKSKVASSMANMGFTPYENKLDVAQLYWASLAGNGLDVPPEEMFLNFIDRAVCFFSLEGVDKGDKKGLKLKDRITNTPVCIDLNDAPMRENIIGNMNKFVLGPSGSGKSFFVNAYLRYCYEIGAHSVIVDTGDSYKSHCAYIRQITNGEDGIYFTYTKEKPISFNPFYSEDREYTEEKIASLCSLLILIWKGQEKVTKTEETEVGNIINGYISLLKSKDDIEPCFNTLYEYIKKDFKRSLQKREEKVSPADFNLSNLINNTAPYYKGGRLDFLLNSKANIDLLKKRFVIFEIDNIKDSKELFPIVTLIIMEVFLDKIRRVKEARKIIIIEEAWKAISTDNMAEYMKWLFKTVRKHNGEAMVVTQEVDDIIQSPIVKEAIISNSDCKILLDQSKFQNRFEGIKNMLGLSDKSVNQILSINKNNNHKYGIYKEVAICLGEHSAVYGVEVSSEEYYTYTTNGQERVVVSNMIEERNGDVISVVSELADKKRKKLNTKQHII